MTNGNGIKQFTEGAAAQSVQFQSQGDAPVLAQPLLLDGFLLRIWSSIPELPAWWSRARDRFLRERLVDNSLIAGICYGECTRIKNMPYTLTHENDDQAALSKWQQILQLADFGAGFPSFASKIALDYLTQDNGIFIEILGSGEIKEVDETFMRRVMENGTERNVPYNMRFIAKGERTGEAIGIAYMDAANCWRTMNREWPVIYQNPYTGQLVVMHWTRVYYDAQFPQGYELGRGLGLCALSRAYETMRLIKSTNQYFFEKITGRAPEIFFANQPVNKLDQALQAGIFNNDNKGFTTFQDPIILAPKSGGVGSQELKFGKMGLLEVPDGFSYKEVIDISVNILAQAFGVDVREIWAATQSGATKADAEIQDIKTTGKGRADILSMVENAINWRILPPDITFKFDEVDDLADKRKAEIKQIRVNTRATQIQSGELSVQEARDLAAQFDDISPEFLENITVADEQTDISQTNPTDQPALPEPNADDTEAQEDSESDDKALDDLKKNNKQYGQTRSLFFNNLITFCDLAARGALSSNNFMSSLKGEIRLAGRAAFLDGIRDGTGNYAIGEAELSDDEIATRNALVETQVSYASGLRDFAYSDPPPSFTEILSRVSLWAAKGIDGIYFSGKLLGAKNKAQVWIYGDTKAHCDTCSAAAGQVHRAKSWLKKGIVPRGDKLLCNGFRCDCRLEDTNLPIKGRLDRIPLKDGKHIHLEM